jgi:hypothetical protein
MTLLHSLKNPTQHHPLTQHSPNPFHHSAYPSPFLPLNSPFPFALSPPPALFVLNEAIHGYATPPLTPHYPSLWLPTATLFLYIPTRPLPHPFQSLNEGPSMHRQFSSRSSRGLGAMNRGLPAHRHRRTDTQTHRHRDRAISACTTDEQ